MTQAKKLTDIDFTVGAREARRAHADIACRVAFVVRREQVEVIVSVERSIRAFQTSCSVQTRIRLAFGNIGFARFTNKTGIAKASELLDAVLARGAVLARQLRAVVDIDLALHAFEAGVGTVAAIIVDEVHTLPVCAGR